MIIPPELDRDGIEHYRLKVERMLNRLTHEAEAWAEAGTQKLDERIALRRPSSGRRAAAYQSRAWRDWRRRAAA